MGGVLVPRVTHFNIHADDLQRAVHFYEQVFSWKFDKWQGAMEYWTVSTGSDDEPGIDGGLSLRIPDFNFNAFVNTVEVENIDECVVKIKLNGGKTLFPKVALPGVGYYVPCQDTEGNHFGILEPDESVL
jgi:predicted enzyme related to lactoylglutathione lyase